MKKIILMLFFFCINLLASAQQASDKKPHPFVNQAGYNLSETKRFTCPKAPDGTPFSIYHAKGTNTKPLFTGTIKGQAGDFTSFNPVSKEEYVIDVKGFGRSVPFWIADHLMEKISSRLAYQFFIDVRLSLIHI